MFVRVPGLLLLCLFFSSVSSSFLRLSDGNNFSKNSEKSVDNNLRPIIGILTQPDSAGEYIAASYVKYVESAGARVVPIRYGSSEQELKYLFDSINGLLLPGGAADLEPGNRFFDTSVKLFKWAVKANQAGDVFPIWGTCLGFEQLHVLAADSNHSVLGSGYDSEDISSIVSLTKDGATAIDSGRGVLGSMPGSLLHSLLTEDISFNAHQQGIDLQRYRDNEKLNNFFTPLATGKDRKGRVFVAIIEAKNNLPIYGVQFHPEKAVFEWHLPSNIPHSFHAIQLSQYFSNFFVNQARKSNHRFSKGFSEESSYLIEAVGKRVVNTTGYFMETFRF